MKESLSGFSFECDSRPSEARSWTLVEEGKEFTGHSIGYCFTGLVVCVLCMMILAGEVGLLVARESLFVNEDRL